MKQAHPAGAVCFIGRGVAWERRHTLTDADNPTTQNNVEVCFIKGVLKQSWNGEVEYHVFFILTSIISRIQSNQAVKNREKREREKSQD